MSDKPSVKPGDWITIAKGNDAVVCNIVNDPNIGDIEVVYLDARNRAINEYVVWKNDKWEYKHEGVSGGYADNYSRLNGCVAVLRRGRYK